MAKRVRTRGFTLIEMMLVVGIIGLVFALAVSQMERANRKRSVEDIISEIHNSLSFTRSLSEMAGPFLGTPDFIQCRTINGTSGPGMGNDLFIHFELGSTPQRILRPTRVRFETPEPPHRMVSDCEWFPLPTQLRFETTSCMLANPRFAFTGLGRTYIPTGSPCGAPADTDKWHLGVCMGTAGCQVSNNLPSLQSTAPAAGVRVLPSGVICRSANKVDTNCDQDL